MVLFIALRAEVLAIVLRAEALVIALRAMVPAHPLAQLRQQRAMGCACKVADFYLVGMPLAASGTDGDVPCSCGPAPQGHGQFGWARLSGVDGCVRRGWP